MIFVDKLNETNNRLAPEFDRLFNELLTNQTHSGDTLLIHINGFYNPEVHNWTLRERLSPYMIGPDLEGHSEELHYKFIHNYRTNAIFDKDFTEYLSDVEYSPDRIDEIDAFVEFEGSSIQLEMLIYLKIWEADAFIKRFYEIARIVNGESYDWHFKISESNRDNNSTGKRHDIIRNKIRNRFQNNYPAIYNAFLVAYKTQIRNSIAHSKYSFTGRNIHPNNFVDSDPAAQLHNLTFNEWIEMFHETMAIYNQYLRLYNRINEHYGEIAEANENRVQVRIERKDPRKETQLSNLTYRAEFKDWRWEHIE